MQSEIDKQIPRALELRDVIYGLPHLTILGPQDDAEISRFFDQAAMGGRSLRLLMQRRPRFHALLEHRGGTSRVLGLRDHEGRLVGTGAFTSTTCFIDRKPGHFVYMADLRIQCKDKDIRREWRECFGRLLKDIPRTRDAGENARLICVIIETNAKAIRVLKENSHNGQRLVQLAPYAMITLFKRLRLRPVKCRRFFAEQGATLEELESFLDSVHREQAFGQCFAAPHYELRRRLKEWKGLSLNDFYVVRDSAGRIVATTALWNPNHCKQSVIEGPWWTKLYNGIARPLGLPQFGQPLKIVYMTHLSFAWHLTPEQRQRVFEVLVERVWPEKKKRKAHGLAFCDFSEFTLTGAVKAYVKVPVKVGMYIAVPEEEAAKFNRDTLGKFPPAFELALV